jgi:hypothetical protein
MNQSRFNEPSKVCFKCQIEQPLSLFYRHKKMGDGHLNKCKSCTKKDVAKHYASNLDKASAYEKERGVSPKRKAKALEYQRRARWRYPDKDRARRLVNHHLRAGTLQKKPCEVCGAVIVEAHHRDYTKPLDVVWLCRVHHRMEHAAILPQRVELAMRQ